MRRKDREVTDFLEISDMIRACSVCRLAIHDTPYPYLVPMNFGADMKDGQLTLYFHAAAVGTKLDLLKKDNRVSFELDREYGLVTDEKSMSCSMRYISVIGQGEITWVPEEEKAAALQILMRQYHKEDFPISAAMLPHTTVLKLSVRSLTAKRRL